MSFTPLFVLDSKTYTLKELEDKINQSSYWHVLYINTQKENDDLSKKYEDLVEKNMKLERELKETNREGIWLAGYNLGISKAKQAFQHFLDTEL